MFLYVFALCIVSFYSSSGAPAPNPVPTGPAPTTRNATNQLISLSILANSCASPFLTVQMKSKLPECTNLGPHSADKEFHCMLFYDINRQLCAAIASSKITLNEDYTAAIEAPQDVTQLCSAASGWTFTNLGETYKNNVQSLGGNVIKCSKVCSVDFENIDDMESNFYCKYFKWGTELLRSHVSPSTHAGEVPEQKSNVIGTKNVMSTIPKSSVPLSEVPSPVYLPAAADITRQDISGAADKTVVPSAVQSPVQGDVQILKNEPQQTAMADKNTSDKPSSTNKDIAESHVEQTIAQPSSISETSPAKLNPDNKVAKESSGTSGVEQAPAPQTKVSDPGQPEKEEMPNKGDEKGSSEGKKVKVADDTKKVDPSIKSVNDQIQLPEDYQSEMDSDEGRGPSDTQGEDDDLGLGDGDQQDLDLTKNTAKKIESQFSNDISQKEYYANADGFPEEDDHFFPFFLTAIIMVVLLYILYHNKSKVSKVIMGLIVEGRQPGRRRNSRGHAYKRLDTLEQAMSANTAAPPSKIIY